MPPWAIVIVIVGVVPLAVFLLCLCIVCIIIYRYSRNVHLEQNLESLIPLTEENAHDIKWMQEVLKDNMIHRYGKINLWSWFDEHVTVDMNELYTDLVWTKRHDLNTSHKIKEYTDMFKVGDQQWSQTNLFLVGDAGTGKSTFVKKIATDWCKLVHSSTNDAGCVEISSGGQIIIQRFEIVILLCLRDIKKRHSIIEAIREQLELKENDAVNISRFIDKNEHKTLLIFDGYDEYRDSTSKDITDILHRRKLQYTNLLITSRHPRAFHFPTEKITRANEVCLRGFSDEGTSVFIGKFFVGDERGTELKQQISQSPYLEFLSHFPAVLLLMAILWRDTRKLSNSITGFYEDFVKYICGRYEQKFVKRKHRADPENIIRKYHNYLMKIGKIAISGMKKDKLELSFKFKSVYTAVGKTGWKLGFFVQEDRPGPDRMVSFPHKTLQEYFVAYYLIHADYKEQKELLLMFCDSKQAVKESEMILTFVHGLGGEEINKQIGTIVKDDDESAGLHVDLQLNYLSQYHDARLVLPPVVKLETNKYPIKMYIKYLESDTSALTRLILQVEGKNVYEEHTSYEELLSQACRTKVLKELTVKEYKLCVIDKIIEYLSDSEMEKLSLPSCSLSSKQTLQLLDQVPDCHSLTDLDLSGNDLRGLMDGTDRLIALTRCHLTTLNMSSSSLTPGDVRPLLVTLPNCTSLKILDISGNNLEGVMGRTEHLTELIGRHLTTLNMSNCGLSSHDVRSLLDMLPDCHSLTDLDLSGNGLWGLMDGTDRLTALTRCHLTTLNMSDSGLTPGDVRPLLVTLPDCPSIKTLDVSDNNLESVMDRTEHLTELIGRHLTTLNMSRSDLTSRDVWLLLDRLPDCHSLADFGLSGNELSGLMEETDNPPRLTHSHLTTLSMSDCGLASLDVLSLLTVIPSCLTNLDVSENVADKELENIVNMTGQLTNLRALSLQYNYIHEEAVLHIRETLSQKCPNLNLLIDEQVS